jgi:hypothetical protein
VSLVRRRPEHRAVVLAALAAPVGAATAHVYVTRALAFVVPAALLVALGLAWALDRLGGRAGARALAPAAFVLLASAQVVQLRAALVDGPLWHTNYGLYGMQYGARQVFDAVRAELADPGTEHVVVSPTWANNVDVFDDFFLTEGELRRVHRDRIERYTVELDEPLAEHGSAVVFVMTPDELSAVRASGLFEPIRVTRTLDYPDGTPGFHLVRMAYVDDIAAVMARAREARLVPVTGTLEVAGETIAVRHSRFDWGALANLMDGDERSVFRVLEANPALVDLTLPAPRPVVGVEAVFSHMDLRLSAEVFPGDGGPPVTYATTYELPPDVGDTRADRPRVKLVFDRGPASVARVALQVEDTRSERAKIHIYEIRLLPGEP